VQDNAVTSLRAYVGMGSNLGDRAGHLLLAVRGMMGAGLRVARLSSIYETEPLDVPDQPHFLNLVAELIHPLPPPEQLLARLLRVEYALGRQRVRQRGARTIDLDLLAYGDERRDTEFLTLPHPRLGERRFVLVPFAELAPEYVPPGANQTIRQILAATPDRAAVVRWSGGEASRR
jgi:2-amino-4-hydroxy-6-hydroxymethyldihydropteridine diphosphokinase